MSRGAFYTTEEDNALIALIKDNPKAKNIDIAKKAQTYNLCSDRNTDALAQHISVLKTPKKAEDEEAVIDITELIWKKRYEDLLRKYEGIMEATIGQAEIWPATGALKLKFSPIAQWIYINEPERLAKRLEELLAEENKGKA